MSEIIAFPLPSGPNFTIPDVDELNWGQEVTNFLVAIPHGVPPTAGTFTLTGDLSFGPSFGLVGKYLTSIASNPASSGFLKLSHNDTLSWRNFAGSGDLPLGVNSADQLTFNGAVPAFTGAVNNGTQFQLGYYAANGGVISGLTLITPNMALESDANGLPVASGVTSTTLSYLDATSSIQTQLNSISAVANAALPEAGGTMSGDIDMGGHTVKNMANGVNPQDAVTVSQLSASIFQPGDLKAAAYASTPTGWLLCDGTAYLTATYPALFAAIGYAYGGAGASFNVPNLVNFVPVGQGGSIAPSLGSSSGATSVTPSAQAHTHTENSHIHSLGSPEQLNAVNYTGASKVAYLNGGVGNDTELRNITAGGGETVNVVSFNTGSQSDTGMSSTTNAMNASSVVQPSLGVNWFIKI